MRTCIFPLAPLFLKPAIQRCLKVPLGVTNASVTVSASVLERETESMWIASYSKGWAFKTRHGHLGKLGIIAQNHQPLGLYEAMHSVR